VTADDRSRSGFSSHAGEKTGSGRAKTPPFPLMTTITNCFGVESGRFDVGAKYRKENTIAECLFAEKVGPSWMSSCLSPMEAWDGGEREYRAL